MSKKINFSLVILTLVLSLALIGSGCGKKGGEGPSPEGETSTLSGDLKLSGSTTVLPLAQDLADKFMEKNPEVRIAVTGGGSGVGVKDAADGKVNIGMASRELKDTDPPGLTATTIAKDAVVVVVHPNNPISELTKEKVKDIFMGNITNWKALGGKDAPIIVHSRVAPSGTLDFFIEEFLGKGENVVATAKTHASNGLLRQSVSANENTIGFLSMGYVDESVKALKMDGVEPTIDNAKNGTYLYVRPLNLVTKGEPADLAKSFIDFATSPEGQEIAGKDYLPL
ncbi:MAG: phosphate ABC transporter substrate-binding protein [Peptococcaceae bacterium]